MSKKPNVISIHIAFEESGATENGRYHDSDEFEYDFFSFLKGDAGVITSHLYFDYDPKKHPDFPDYRSAWGGNIDLPIGGQAWENFTKINNDAHFVATNNAYDAVTGDKAADKYALSHGLLDRLPASFIYVSPGPGDMDTFMGKDGLLVEAALKEGKNIEALIVLDTNGRWAIECAQNMGKEYELTVAAAISDFLERGYPPKLSDTPHVIVAHGGTFDNAPRAHNASSQEQKAIEYRAKIPKAYGPGTIFIQVVDTEDNAAVLNKRYEATPEFKSFVLSGFARAKIEGLITDPDYDVWANWDYKPRYNAKGKVEELVVVCKQDHIMPTVRGDYKFKAGSMLRAPDERIAILSGKQDINTHVRMLRKAGFTGEITSYQHPQSKRVLICAIA